MTQVSRSQCPADGPLPPGTTDMPAGHGPAGRGQADPLAAYLDGLIAGSAYADTGAEAAQHIREVLGYRQQRQVESAEELDVLPDRTIIRTRYGTAAQKSDEAWEFPNEVGQFLGEAIDLPVTVLWSPPDVEGAQ